MRKQIKRIESAGRRRVLLAMAVLLGTSPLTLNAAEPEAEAPPLIPVVMQFDWLFNAQFAGLYQAIEQGYYREAGLDVELRGGLTTPDTVAATLAEPAISFGSTESNVLLGDVASGAKAVALGTMFQNSPMGWMYLKDGTVTTFTDLAQLRVGIHSDGERVISLLLKQQGADVSTLETFKASHDAQLLLDGEADALQCYYIDEYVKLTQLVGERAGIFLAKDFGYQAYSQVIFTHRDTLREHPDVVRKFLAATKKGWAYAFENQEQTVDLILAKYNPELDRDYQLGSLARIRELMEPHPGALFQPMSPVVLHNGMNSLLDYGLIKRPVDVTQLLQQQFLP